MNRHISRRCFISASSTISIGVLSGITKRSDAEEADISFATDFTPQKKCFMDQYYDGILEIIKGIRDTQIDNISRAMEKAYECKQKGGTIYSNVVFGHFAAYAGSSKRPGQPNVLPQYYSLLNGPFDEMKKGDFLLTNIVNLDMNASGIYQESDD